MNNQGQIIVNSNCLNSKQRYIMNEVRFKLREGKRYNIGDFFKDSKYFIMRTKIVNISNKDVIDEISIYMSEIDLLETLKTEFVEFERLSNYHCGNDNYEFFEDSFFRWCTATTDHNDDHYMSVEVSNLNPLLSGKIRELFDKPLISEEANVKEESDNKMTIIDKPFILPEFRST